MDAPSGMIAMKSLEASMQDSFKKDIDELKKKKRCRCAIVVAR